MISYTKAWKKSLTDEGVCNRHALKRILGEHFSHLEAERIRMDSSLHAAALSLDGRRPKCATCHVNFTAYSPHLKAFKKYCSPQCSNTNPGKIKLQCKTQSKGFRSTERYVSETLAAYASRTRVKGLSRKTISAFSAIIIPMCNRRAYPKESDIMRALPEALLNIWCRLPVHNSLGRRMLALGQMPFSSPCEACGKPVTSYTTRGWATFCSHSCRAKTRASKDVSHMVRGMKEKLKSPAYRKARVIRWKKSIQKKYGVDNVSQVPEIRAKQIRSGIRRKECTLRGETILVQGYEPIALNYLIERFGDKYIEVEHSGNVPAVDYKFKGKMKKHYPDMYLADKNCIVEVKSNLDFRRRGLFRKLKAKAIGARAMGYRYVVLMIHGKWRYVFPRGWEEMTHAQFKKAVTYEELSQAVRKREYA